jgi:serine/threonine-protein kinase
VDRIGRYRLVERVGSGGTGSVYSAVLEGPARFRKHVAVKILEDGDLAIAPEARLGGLLRHANLVEVYELGEHDGTWFCSMELMSTGSLEHHRATPAETVRIALDVCNALTYLHEERALVHLDVKPANLFVEHGITKLGDLGSARAIGSPAASHTPGRRSTGERTCSHSAGP